MSSPHDALGAVPEDVVAVAAAAHPDLAGRAGLDDHDQQYFVYVCGCAET